MSTMSVGNDRAWNDPPPLPISDYQGSCSKRTLLNKRVAFPLHKPGGMAPENEVSDSSRKATIESIPSAMSCPPVESNSSVFSDPEITKDVLQNNVPDEEMLSTIQSTFETIINGFTEVSEEDIAAINKKLAIFRDSWPQKLSPFVKQKVFQLATELAAGNIEAADKLHHGLVVSSVKEVAPWMVGVKHIIQNAQKIAPEMTDDKGSGDAQVLDACTFHPDNSLKLLHP